MGKKKEKKPEKKQKKVGQPDMTNTPVLEPSGGSQSEEEREPKPPMNRKDFEKAVEPIQYELVKMQEWVKYTGAKICVIFEGRDTAGKGGVIKRITERVSPRVFRVVALSAPTEREKSQMYFQRYMPYLPAAGEVVLFDRSWYNRAGVMGCWAFSNRV